VVDNNADGVEYTACKGPDEALVVEVHVARVVDS
jgi:hypothetical protein